MSAAALKDMGLEKVSHIESGFKGWKEAGLPVTDHATWKSQAKG